MRTTIGILAAGALAALTACGGPPDHLDPKASYPDAGTGNIEVPRTGQLAVRTNPDVITPSGGKVNWHELHPKYIVYDSQGKRVGEVHNRLYAGGVEELTRARLPVGRYLVRIEDGSVFWVTVSPDELTLVDADALAGRFDSPKPEPEVEPRVPPSE